MNSKKYANTYYEFREINNLKELVDSSAELYGSSPAFQVKEQPGGEYVPVSYDQFRVDIYGLGTALLKKGMKGKKIAVIGENSYEWVVAYLAVTNGVGVAVPLDRELHIKDIAGLMARAEVSAVIHSRKTAKLINDVMEELKELGYDGLELVIDMQADEDGRDGVSMKKLVEEGKEAVNGGDLSYKDTEIDDDAMCALLFTSGTTGRAKGVMLSHRNIAANVYNMSKYVNVTGGTGLSVLPMHHTYELTCHIFTGLYQGIDIAICEGLKYIIKNMQESGATVMLGVPLVFETLHKRTMRTAEQSGQLPKMLKAMALSKKFKLYNKPAVTKKMFKAFHDVLGNNMNQFIAGGAAINPKIIEDFEAMGLPMMQGYGMTENAPIIAVNRDRYSKPASVGQAMPGTEIRIVDKDEKGMGEIICKGPSVMLGYYNDPEETAKVLVDGWLYTGDYGYMDDEGFLYISGRKKNVIVTKNGKNIFPEEIEALLLESGFIQEVLVHGVDGGKGGDTIIKAEVYPDFERVAEVKGDITDDELREFIGEIIEETNERTPLYKRVKRFSIRKTEFEKTTTRKIKRYSAVNWSNGEEDEKNAEQ